MATTRTEICNIGLRRARAGTIGNFDDDDSAEGVECRTFYDATRRKLLQTYSWRFAKTTKALSLKSLEPDEWLYAYDYPNDCLKIHYIIPPESGKNIVTGTGIATPRIDYEPIPYEVGVDLVTKTKIVLTDYEDAFVSYLYNAEEVSLFDPLFEDSLEWLLAAEFAIPLGGDSGIKYRDAAIKGFNESIQRAMASTANESESGRQRLPREIQARHGAVDRDYFYSDLIYRRY